MWKLGCSFWPFFAKTFRNQPKIHVMLMVRRGCFFGPHLCQSRISTEFCFELYLSLALFMYMLMWNYAWWNVNGTLWITERCVNTWNAVTIARFLWYTQKLRWTRWYVSALFGRHCAFLFVTTHNYCRSDRRLTCKHCYPWASADLFSIVNELNGLSY